MVFPLLLLMRVERTQSRFLANALPECDLRYFSNSNGLRFVAESDVSTLARPRPELGSVRRPRLRCDLPCGSQHWQVISVFRLWKCSSLRALKDVDVLHQLTCRSGFGPPSLFELRRAASLASLRTLCRLAKRSRSSEGWWSQTGSNRRPRECHSRALPTELWPQPVAAAMGCGWLSRTHFYRVLKVVLSSPRRRTRRR